MFGKFLTAFLLHIYFKGCNEYMSIFMTRPEVFPKFLIWPSNTNAFLNGSDLPSFHMV